MPLLVSDHLQLLVSIFLRNLEGIWYLRKVASSCKQFGSVSTSLRPKYIQFCSHNLENGRKDKTGRRRIYFSFDNKKKFPLNFAEIELLFFIFQTKSCLSTSVFIFSAIPQILQTKFDLFWS